MIKVDIGEGRNLTMNAGYYCWVSPMTIGQKDIHSVVGEFARVLLWEADERFLSRLLVRARVTDL